MSEVIERDPLVNHKLIEDWQAEATAAAERLVAARSALTKAQAADTAAGIASERTIANGGDAHAAELELEKTARARLVALKVYDAAASAVARSNERRQIVSGLAHKGLYEDGIRQRVAASRRWDAARAEVAAAEADRCAADLQMRQALQAGLYDLHGALDHPDPMKTEEQERAHWRSRGIDPDDPQHPARMPTEISTAEAYEQGLVRMSNGERVTYVHPSAVAAHVASGWI